MLSLSWPHEAPGRVTVALFGMRMFAVLAILVGGV